MNNQKQNPIMDFLEVAKGNPNAMYQQLMRNNPQFRNFVNSNQGKTPEQIAQEHGVDMNLLRNLMR